MYCVLQHEAEGFICIDGHTIQFLVHAIVLNQFILDKAKYL